MTLGIVTHLIWCCGESFKNNVRITTSSDHELHSTPADGAVLMLYNALIMTKLVLVSACFYKVGTSSLLVMENFYKKRSQSLGKNSSHQ